MSGKQQQRSRMLSSPDYGACELVPADDFLPDSVHPWVRAAIRGNFHRTARKVSQSTFPRISGLAPAMRQLTGL